MSFRALVGIDRPLLKNADICCIAYIQVFWSQVLYYMSTDVQDFFTKM